MKLPYLNYSGNRKERQGLTFGGINVRANAAEGELRESRNLSSQDLPVLTQRGGRQSLGLWQNGTAMTAWEGLVVVAGSDLYYNGDRIGAVTPGEKQFAFVNTKLCIFPDKLYIDMSDRKVKRLDGKYYVTAGNGTFTADKLTVTTTPKIGEDGGSWEYKSDSLLYVMTYTALEWDEGWVKTGGTAKELGSLAAGDLLIPRAGALGSWETITGANDADALTQGENTEGVYFKVTGASKTDTAQYKWEKFNCAETTYLYYTQGTVTDNGYFAGEVNGAAGYRFNSATGKFSTYGGEKIVGAGKAGSCYAESNDGKKLLWATNSGDGYNLYERASKGPYVGTSYSRGTTSYGYVYGASGAYPNGGRASDGYWYQLIGATGYDRTATARYDLMDAAHASGSLLRSFRVGDVVSITGGNNARERIRVTEITEDSVTFEGAGFTAGTTTEDMTLQRPIPDLDYVCAKDNRLWGVCNAQKGEIYDGETKTYKTVNARIIYASALGDPANFFQFDGLSTDAYAVAVGTEGDFTGCTGEYGDVLLFWKERKLHVIYGSYPEEYSMSTFTVNGLQAGSHKSQRVINNVLYYKGTDGVYAFTGTTPSLVSYKLGEPDYRYACAGADGFRYYISMQNAESGEWGLWVYDTLRDVWMREDETHGVDMTFYNGHVAWMDETGEVWQAEVGTDGDIQWTAEFTPLYEDTLEQKEYTDLWLRLELAENARVRVETARDYDQWETAWESDFTRRNVTVPLRPYRCDRLRVRLSGTGLCAVRAMGRGLSVGSMYP